MIRDLELERLIKYAQGLDVKVLFKTATATSDAAEWTLDGTEIRIYKKASSSKMDIILALIHELGHCLWWIHEKSRKPDLKFEEAIDIQNLIAQDLTKNVTPKKYRKTILDREIAGTNYWEVIYKDTNMKFPKWRLFAEKEIDIWIYQVYCDTGRFPKSKERREKRYSTILKHKELSIQYGAKQ